MKSKLTSHGKRRIKQRYGGRNDVEREELARRAINSGIRVHQIPPSNPILPYVESKIAACDKKVMILEGYIFIFFHSRRLITMYPIPDEYLEAYEKIKPIEEKNKTKYREQRKTQHKYHSINKKK